MTWNVARHLTIKHSDNPNRWSWRTETEGEIASLVKDQVLDIKGKTDATQTGHNYRAFLVFKLDDDNENIDTGKAGVGAGKVTLHQISIANGDPPTRTDGWFEVAIGDFAGTSDQLNIHVTGAEDHSYKSGLILRGIEYREIHTWIVARHLTIKHSDNPNRWSWSTETEGEIASLVKDQVLDIKGKTDATEIGHTYRAFLVFKLDDDNENIDTGKAGIGAGEVTLHEISIANGDPQTRTDGWFEVAIGDFAGTSDQLNIHITGAEDQSEKSGLILRGIEYREI